VYRPWYPASNGYMEHVRSNIRRFIAARYGVSQEEAEPIRLQAFMQGPLRGIIIIRLFFVQLAFHEHQWLYS